MTVVDWLLNLVGVSLWLGWRVGGWRASPGAAAPYSGLLQGVAPRPRRRRWCLVALVGLLVLRAPLYWRVGMRVDWVPSVDLGVLTLSFNSVSWERMGLYSGLSFGILLSGFYLGLLLLSVLNRETPDTDVWQRGVRECLGWFERWPIVLKLVVPGVLGGLAWWVAQPHLAEMGMAAPAGSARHLAQQSALVGAGVYLAWKPVVLGVLILAVLNSYLYLGSWRLWTFVQSTARGLLWPVRRLPMKVGRVDFAPVAALAVLWLVFRWAETGMSRLYGHLPL